MPYQWRKLRPEEQENWLARRKLLKRPWHCPPHFEQGNIHYILSAACYEHRPYIGHSVDRMQMFSARLLDTLPATPVAWCVLPNHYQVLIRCEDIGRTVKDLGLLHGRTSFQWNGEEKARGRKVWHSVSDRAMQNAEHFWATINYIHHNPVKHGYVDSWSEWPFSSADDYIEAQGRKQAANVWRQFPILEYGKGWDDDWHAPSKPAPKGS